VESAGLCSVLAAALFGNGRLFFETTDSIIDGLEKAGMTADDANKLQSFIGALLNSKYSPVLGPTIRRTFLASAKEKSELDVCVLGSGCRFFGDDAAEQLLGQKRYAFFIEHQRSHGSPKDLEIF
jgi:hypothetical protein